MAKKYKGSLTLEWKNKNKSILLATDDAVKDSDTPVETHSRASLHWVNEDESLYYEIDSEKGKGLTAYWVDRNDIRVKEVRPLLHQKTYSAKPQPITQPVEAIHELPLLVDPSNPQIEYKIVESSAVGDVASVNDAPLTQSNLLIKGDNLLALNALVKLFENKPEEEKPKCICIDPPYNTGSAFEQYDDNLEHSEWLTLMRDRLTLLRKLLREDGSIWISVDDRESHYLKVLCDEVFGRKNFISNVIWEKSDSPRMDALYFSNRHDHILVFSKDIDLFLINRIESNKEDQDHYNKIDNDNRLYYLKPLRSMGQNDAREDRPSMYFFLIAPDGKKVYPKRQDGSDGCWRWGQEKIEQEKDRIEWVNGRNGWTPYYKIYADNSNGKPPETIWFHEDVGSNRTSKKEIKEIFEDDKSFDTPKPERLIHRILHIATNHGDVVLDIFAGSGTTLAVAHKMGRKWIGVEMGNHADTHILPRLQKVLSGEDQGGISKTVNWKGGGSFSYYHLGQSMITLKQDGSPDFNWKLGREELEKNLLLTYDFQIEESKKFTIGFKALGGKVVAGIVSLNEPESEDEFISYAEFRNLYDLVMKKKPVFITLYTNKGVQISETEIPENLEIVKVPSSIFQELER